jgi:hypothetical protein
MMMKQEQLMVTHVVPLCMGILCLFIQGCKPPKVRPGSSFDGSAKWALQIAQPVISDFAVDAQIYQVLGALVWKDGRLPANTGTWSYVSWSASLKKTCQVTVDCQGNSRTSIRDSQNPPNTGSSTTLPVGWVNSTSVFSAVPGQEITKSYAQLVVFNTTSYPQAPNTAVWAMNFAGGRNPLVRWDGHYIGTQAD